MQQSNPEVVARIRDVIGRLKAFEPTGRFPLSVAEPVEQIAQSKQMLRAAIEADPTWAERMQRERPEWWERVERDDPNEERDCLRWVEAAEEYLGRVERARKS